MLNKLSLVSVQVNSSEFDAYLMNTNEIILLKCMKLTGNITNMELHDKNKQNNKKEVQELQ